MGLSGHLHTTEHHVGCLLRSLSPNVTVRKLMGQIHGKENSARWTYTMELES